MKIRKVIIVFIGGLLLSGCSVGQALGPTMTPSPTATNTQTNTPTPVPTVTMTPLPTATFSNSDWLIINPAMDVTDIEVTVKGDLVEAVFYLKYVPEELPFFQDGIPENTIEYSWAIYVDVDNDKKTGLPPGGISEGSDYVMEAVYRKIEENELRGSMPIEKGVTCGVSSITGQSMHWIAKETMQVNPDDDTIILSGHIPGITESSLFYFETLYYIPGAHYDSDFGPISDRVTFQ